jgi:hypothetical protein
MDMRMRGVGRFLTVFGAVAFLACGGDATTGLTDPKVDTTKTTTPVDTAAANAAARTKATNTLLTQINDALTAMGQSQGVGGGVPGGPPGSAAGMVTGGGLLASSATLANSPPPADAAKCAFDSTATRWNCPEGTNPNGTTVKSWFQFLDSTNKPMKFLDSVKTVLIRRFVGTTGTIKTQLTTKDGTFPANDTTNDADTVLLAGVNGPAAQRKVTSSGALKHVLVPEGQPVARISATKTTQDFKFDPPGPNGEPPARRYPIAGKITLVLTSSQEGVANSTATTTQTTTYDGTAIATLVIKNLQGTTIRTCTYDMTAQNSPANCK